MIFCCPSYTARALQILSANAMPSEGKNVQRSAVDKTIYSLTVYDHPHIPEETVDDLKRLRCRRPSLVLGQSV